MANLRLQLKEHFSALVIGKVLVMLVGGVIRRMVDEDVLALECKRHVSSLFGALCLAGLSQ